MIHLAGKKKDEPLEEQSKADLQKRADKQNVDVEGSGQGGRVLKQDLVDALDGGSESKDVEQNADGQVDATRPDLEQVANPDAKQVRREKALDEVRELHEKQRADWRHHNRTEVEFEIRGVPEDGEDEGPTLNIRTAGGRVYVSCSAKEVVLDHDGAADLQRNAQTAFQAAS